MCFMEHSSPNNDNLELTTLSDLKADFGFGPQATEASGNQAHLASRYEMLLMVGEGAMGQVFLAKDEDLLRKVAYKRLHETVGVNPEVVARFLREAQITAQLEHPNVVPIYDLEKTDLGWAYAMKLVFGKTFKELIQNAREAYDHNRLPDEEYQLTTLLEHFLKVCEALEFAHQKGVLHRDLKPANIMVGRYREVYVMDWGIARLIGPQGEENTNQNNQVALSALENGDENGFDQTHTGQILGTPRYLSPEQAAGKNDQLDGRSDLLTLGLILYELAFLKPAYHARDLTSLLKTVLKTETAPMVPYHKLCPVARELIAIIHKATARRKEDRYQSVKELAEDLRRYLRGQSVLAEPDNALQSLRRWLGQHQAATVGTGLTILLILASLSIGTIWNQRKQFFALKHQESRLNDLQTAVSRQAQLINNNLLSYNALLMRLEAVCSGAISTSQGAQKLYLNQAFTQTNQEPSDYQYYPGYSKMLSLNWPVWNLPQYQTQPSQRNLPLSRINQNLKEIFRDSIKPSTHSPNASLSEIFKTQKLPLVWAHIALDDGAYLVYPGQTGFPDAYRPQNTNWYKLGMQSNHVTLTPSHTDILGQGLLLSIVMPIHNKDDQKVGVVGLDLSFQYLIDHLLNLELAGAFQHYLINQEGKIILKSSDRNRYYGMRYGSGQAGQAIDTPLFDQSSVVSEIQSGHSGYRRLSRNGRNVLIAYYRLNSLGWFYAVEVDEKSFMNKAKRPANSAL